MYPCRALYDFMFSSAGSTGKSLAVAHSQYVCKISGSLKNDVDIRTLKEFGAVSLKQPGEVLCEVTRRRHRVSPCRSAY